MSETSDTYLRQVVNKVEQRYAEIISKDPGARHSRKNTREEDDAIARHIAVKGVTRIETRTVAEVCLSYPYRVTQKFEGMFE